jgi:predicted O-methyltransferase YrrM
VCRSDLYLGARNGGGTVIGSEIVPETAATARRNLADAGSTELSVMVE